ncbi:hypothetical protein [Nocardia brasiliensis]|uniref:hypothetical protein n=1 Tax=Nocardia brasiliensis TaxID=37326 RepID=UPI00245627F7|nr:hypothetical protein [Nocardia brasiliensis]
MTHTGEVDRQATVLADCSAAWHVDHGTIYVDTLRKGRSVIALGGIELGKAFGRMPRNLWDRVRFDFELQRDRSRGGAL